jgi:hypothetical protein
MQMTKYSEFGKVSIQFTGSGRKAEVAKAFFIDFMLRRYCSIVELLEACQVDTSQITYDRYDEIRILVDASTGELVITYELVW